MPVKRLCALVVIVGLSLAQAQAATLEIPTRHTTLSGIGIVSGWKCDAGELTVRFNGGPPVPLLYGAERPDVLDAGACDTAEVGFLTIWNYGELGDGEHTAIVYDDEVEFARSTFEVVTFGEAFVRGEEKVWTLTDWPDFGTDVTIAWNEATQNIGIIDITPLDIPPHTPPLLTQLLGRWYFQDEQNGFLWLGYIFTEVDGEQVTGTTDNGIFPVFGRLNTTPWLGQPLMQYEMYVLLERAGSEGTRPFCHVYVFNYDADTNKATGYYWDGIGSTLAECEQNADGPYRASGGQR